MFEAAFSDQNGIFYLNEMEQVNKLIRLATLKSINDAFGGL